MFIFLRYTPVLTFFSCHTLNFFLPPHYLHQVSFNKYFFKKVFFVGLGYKLFRVRQFLGIFLGHSHYIFLYIPKHIFLFTKKKRIYVVSRHLSIYNSFIQALFASKKQSIYKAKGLFLFKKIKGKLLLRKGKKQQF